MKDTFQREIDYLRLSVTDLCNLRCRYCMPESGIPKKCHTDMLTEEEMVMAASAAAQLGIRKVRITGGETLVKRNILSICEKIHAIPQIKKVCLTTNGYYLSDMAQSLKQAGVSGLNISLDTLDAEKYRQMTRGGELSAVLRGIETAQQAGFDRLKINCVLVGGFNDDATSVTGMAALAEQGIDVRFIELMPIGNSLCFPKSAYVSTDAVLSALPALRPIEQTEHSVARMYQMPQTGGRIGLISPLSNHFCSSCNKIRITADGKVKPCLHSKDEYALKGKTQEQMLTILRDAIVHKPRMHHLNETGHSDAQRMMHAIGG